MKEKNSFITKSSRFQIIFDINNILCQDLQEKPKGILEIIEILDLQKRNDNE